jgi:signal transduction histidine kinase
LATAQPAPHTLLRWLGGLALCAGLLLAAQLLPRPLRTGWQAGFVLCLSGHAAGDLALVLRARWRPGFSLPGALACLLPAVLAGSVVGWLAYRHWVANAPLRLLPDAAALACPLLLALALLLQQLRQQRRAQLAQEAQWRADEQARTERRLLEQELRALQAQIEPHFLYNTLASVQQLIATEPAQAGALTTHMIAYLRAALPGLRASSSTVAQELALASHYLEIMRIRLGSRFSFAVHASAAAADLPFPPAVLMSVVENAVQHGIEPKPGPVHIAITAEVDGEALQLTVRDNGAGLPATVHDGNGLGNLRERLHKLHGVAARFSLQADAHTGGRGDTIACITIPLPPSP